MNDHRRHTTTRISGTIPRSSIESFRHASIDTFLKDLRNITRRVRGFSTPYAIELQVLERIYYKGKNQHGSAFFWRRVLEVRRLGARIKETNVLGSVEDFRYAFYVENTNKANINPSSGAWEQAPDNGACASMLNWLRSSCLLIDHTQARFRLAHEAFAMQIGTATFIPLATSLLSVTSRLNFLVSELREILALQWQAVAGISQIIGAPDANIHHTSLFPKDPFDSTALVTTRGSGIMQPKGSKVYDHEELGDKVIRDSHLVLMPS